MSRVPLLDADLELPDGRLRLTVGGAVELPDDPRHVAALLGDGRRGHRVRLEGRRLDRRSPAARVRAGLVAVGDAPVAPGLGVLDHLAAIVGPGEARRLLESTPHLAGRGDDPGGVLSGGERRLLAWSLARARRPRVVVLDRAGTGLDEEALAFAEAQVASWRARGVGVLVRVGRDEERAWLAPCGGPVAP